MTQPSDVHVPTEPQSRPPRTRTQKELIWAGIFLGLGFIALPLGIYFVGVAVLGPYGGGPHIGSFFGDFFRNLASGTVRTWFIVLSPYLAFLLFRAIFFRWRIGTDMPADPSSADRTIENRAAQEPYAKERREPFVAP